MVVAFLVAVVLDNTVRGSRQERGVYVWSEPEAAQRELAFAKDYGLPFRWADGKSHLDQNMGHQLVILWTCLKILSCDYGVG
ncbi:hypothetical protein L6452_09650 [Arctium lappa]|uniref:Uncharacterized protein n=1 Tax=Arctium lappa TaxID=4217 RepID=A0ACB9DKM8_ARCLA|nr:hypothetical protein L6452_09650 [Arctium lappa]